MKTDLSSPRRLVLARCSRSWAMTPTRKSTRTTLTATRAFTVAITALTGILFGLAPAMRAGALRVSTTVRAQVGSADRSRPRLGRLLIVLQVAVSLVLLVSAALFLRTLRNLHTVETGFDTTNVLLFRVKPQSNGYTDATIGPLYDRMIDRLRGVPGVTGVALSRQPYRQVDAIDGTPNPVFDRWLDQLRHRERCQRRVCGFRKFWRLNSGNSGRLINHCM